MLTSSSGPSSSFYYLCVGHLNNPDRLCHWFMYRSVYDITVTPKFDKPTSAGSRAVQKVQVMVPGPPDPPQIWTRRSRHRHGDGWVEEGEDEVVIEWSEPRLNGAKVAGYQVYINGKKTGNVLGSNHRKAIIPLKGKRSVLFVWLVWWLGRRTRDREVSGSTSDDSLTM